MNVLVLPQYTNERFYILSEIEQRANFSALDDSDLQNYEEEGKPGAANKMASKDLEGSSSSTPKLKPLSKIAVPEATVEEPGAVDSAVDPVESLIVTPDDFKAVYVIWDLRKKESDVKCLLDSIALIVESCADIKSVACRSRYFLSVEIIIPKMKKIESSWEACPQKQLIDEAFQAVVQRFQFGLTGFGISDHMAGCPAISGVLEWFNQLSSIIPGMANTYGDSIKLGRVVSASRSDFLGFSAKQAPDAASGVYQIWLTSRNPESVAGWSKGIIDTSTTTSAICVSQAQMSNSPTFVIYVFLALFVAFVSYLLYR